MTRQRDVKNCRLSTAEGVELAVAMRLTTVMDTCEAIETAKRCAGGFGLELQVDDQRAMAEQLKLPYVAVLLMLGESVVGNVMVDDLHSYHEWKHRGLLERLLAEREAAAEGEEG